MVVRSGPASATGGGRPLTVTVPRENPYPSVPSSAMTMKPWVVGTVLTKVEVWDVTSLNGTGGPKVWTHW